MTAPAQILHILKKDAWHLYPEIANHLAMLIAFGWVMPKTWTGGPGSMDQTTQLIGMALHVLLPTAWVILVSRLVHDESLVGDRQFWLTRPYRWETLLGAKVLFLAVFVWLPLLVMQMYLLHHAGLAVVAGIPGLLKSLGLTVGIVFLPLMANAAVTSGFGKMALTLLGSFLYLLLLGTGTAQLSAFQETPPYVSKFVAGLAAVLISGIIAFQYRRRRTVESRWMLAGTALMACVLVLLGPAGLLFRHAYPEITAAADVHPQMSFNMDPAHGQPGVGAPFLMRGNVFLLLPVTVSGVPAEMELEGKAIQMRLEGADGFRWDSTWQIFPGMVENGPAYFGVVMPHSAFAKVGVAPMTVTLTMAVSELRKGMPEAVVSRMDGYRTPGGGVCSFLPEQFMLPVCRYPMPGPELTLISAPVIQTPCGLDSPATTEQTGTPGLAALAGVQHLPIVLDPVLPMGLRFQTRGAGPNQAPRVNALCPGTTVTFAPFGRVSDFRMELSQVGVKLGDYVRHGRVGPVE
ncbi:hypothetical protein [Granulicella sibirica]|uniref:Uncharacterized protein n=1 Tax=Granulicella sibirica TaxID=2479048 RepID=A0A4Q0T5A3_9BACT|nr:hypothetical protein [Granulicella sibirica]RXH57199.1 hypothetical protein GRAN_0509 [Granulicella sibirica]